MQSENLQMALFLWNKIYLGAMRDKDKFTIYMLLLGVIWETLRSDSDANAAI